MGELRLPALLAAATGVGFFIGMWRWIAERSRPNAAASRPDPRREALGRWAFWTIFFAAFLALGLYRWARGEDAFILLLAIGGIGTAISARRWIAAKARPVGEP